MLYRRALGPAFDTLPPALRRFHAGQGPREFEGTAEVRHGHALARLLVRSAGFPMQSGHMPIRLTITKTEDGEIWERRFGGHVTRSRQWLARPGVIAERVGPATILMRPDVTAEALRLPMVGFQSLGVSLPAGLMPQSGGVERVGEGEAILFDVTATAWVLGPLIRYTGAITPLA